MDASPKPLLFSLWRKGMGYLNCPYNYGPLLLTPPLCAPWSGMQGMSLCIRPLDLLQGDMVMGTGHGEPFSGKWFLPGLGKHSLNAHITLKYLSPWLALRSFQIVWNWKTSWEVSNKRLPPSNMKCLLSFYLSLKIKQQTILSGETRLFTLCVWETAICISRYGQKGDWSPYPTTIRDIQHYVSLLSYLETPEINKQTQ